MKQRLFVTVLGLVVIAHWTGCAAFRQSVKDSDPEGGDSLTARYDQRDLLSWTDEMVQLIMDHPFPPAGEERPIVAAFNIQNRTKTHLDTQALMDTITMKLLDAGEIRLANTNRRDELLGEQGYQLANATPASRVAVGRQLGAKYMLTGSLVQIDSRTGRQVRLSRQEDVFYQLTLEVTDLETGLVELRKQVERMRSIRKPIIGW